MMCEDTKSVASCTSYFTSNSPQAPSRWPEIYPASSQNMHYFIKMQVLSAQKESALYCYLPFNKGMNFSSIPVTQLVFDMKRTDNLRSHWQDGLADNRSLSGRLTWIQNRFPAVP